MIDGLDNPADGDGLGIFGKDIRKKRRLSDILKALSQFAPEEEEDDEYGGSDYLSLKAQSGSPPVYDPNRIYGGLYKMYGGRRVRGGLLGD